MHVDEGAAMRFLFAFVALSSLLVGTGCQAESPKGKPAEDRKQAFDWFSGLGYPETKDSKLVAVTTGHWSQHANDPPENRVEYAFLVESKDGTFRVRGIDFQTEEY